MEQKTVRGRFAPSPSGRMHLGNLWSALLAWLSARSQGGEMVLRLEDLDPDRCTRAWCDQVMRDLEWLGLTWDNEPVYQSERTAVYAEAFHALEERGLIYPCYCTRAERLAASAPHRSDGQTIYDGRCSRLTEAEREALSQTRRPAWRVKVGQESITFCDFLYGEYKEDLKTDCGDFILRRSDGVYAYQLAVVVDDAAMGVNQVVRGSDLLSSTPRQIYLQRLLGLPQPEYGHVPLLLSADGRRQAGPGPGAGGAPEPVYRARAFGPPGPSGWAHPGACAHHRPAAHPPLFLGKAPPGGPQGGKILNYYRDNPLTSGQNQI